MHITAAHIGSCVGFLAFVASLEMKGMGNIVIRNGHFAPLSILNYILNVFYRRFLWYPRFWIHNWIIMTSLGYLCGKLYGYYF